MKLIRECLIVFLVLSVSMLCWRCVVASSGFAVASESNINMKHIVGMPVGVVESAAQKSLKTYDANKRTGKRGKRIAGVVGGIVVIASIVVFGIVAMSRRKKEV